MAKKCNIPNSQPRGVKTPRVAFDPNRYDSFSPSWRFNRCDKEQWALPIDTFTTEIMPKLQSLEKLTWIEIKKATHDNGKSKNHFVNVAELIKEAQKRLSELHLDEYDELFSLRLNNKYRIYGIIDCGVFIMIWFDPKHEIYPIDK